MLYIKLFIEREKSIGQSAPECPFNVPHKRLQQQDFLPYRNINRTRRHKLAASSLSYYTALHSAWL